MIDINSVTYEKLNNVITDLGQPEFRTKQIFTWLHKNGVSSFDEMTNISKSLREKLSDAVSLLAGIPSVVYGLVGMLVLVPAIRKTFHLPDGASLFAAIIVLAVMILPSIIKVSVTALEAVPPEYEEASLALGATKIETIFKVSIPAAKSGIVAGIVLGIGRARRGPRHRRSDGRDDGLGQRAEHARLDL